MFVFRRSATVLIVIASAVGACAASTAVAAEQPFGTHVADCAQTSVGQRPEAPQVTCTHNATTMNFPNFGAMLQHMLADT